MRNRVLVGVGAGLLTGALVLGVGAAAFNAGRDDEVTRTVTDESGEVVRVVEVDGWRDRGGPGLGIVLVPVALLGVGFLAYGAGRRHGSGWGPRYGPGPGAWGPGPGGWGPGPAAGGGGWGARHGCGPAGPGDAPAAEQPGSAEQPAGGGTATMTAPPPTEPPATPATPADDPTG
jgi:hypothetical protein